VKTKPMEILQ